MKEKQVEQLIAILQQAAHKLGTTGEQLWRVMVHGKQMEGLCTVITIAVITLLTSACVVLSLRLDRWVNKVERKEPDSREDWSPRDWRRAHNEYSEEAVRRSNISAVVLISAIVGSVATSISVYHCSMRFLCPDYLVLNRLLDMALQLHRGY